MVHPTPPSLPVRRRTSRGERKRRPPAGGEPQCERHPRREGGARAGLPGAKEPDPEGDLRQPSGTHQVQIRGEDKTRDVDDEGG